MMLPRLMLLQLLLLSLFISFAAHDSAAATLYSQTQSDAVSFPSTTPIVLTFTDTPAAATDATLSLIATGGELNLANKRLESLLVDGVTYQTDGSPAGWILPINHATGSGAFPLPVTIPHADLTTYVADGQVEVSVVRPSFLGSGSFDLVLEYTTAIPEPTSIALLGLALATLLPRRRR